MWKTKAHTPKIVLQHIALTHSLIHAQTTKNTKERVYFGEH